MLAGLARRGWATALGVALVAGLLVPEPDRDELAASGLAHVLLGDFEATTEQRREGLERATLLGALESAADTTGLHAVAIRIARPSAHAPWDATPFVRAVRSILNRTSEARRQRGLPGLVLVSEPGSGAVTLELELLEEEGGLEVRGTVAGEPFGRVHEEDPWRAPGRGSLIPALLAISVALIWRRPLLALFAGICIGAVLLEVTRTDSILPALGSGLLDVLRVFLWNELMDSFRIEIVGFVVALLAMVGVMTRSGGFDAIVAGIGRFADGVRSTLAATFGLGLLVFFDDYANCLLVGSTMRPLTDRMRISREKLAYIVDSTAAPVAGISILSTWIAFEVSTYAPQLPAVGIALNPYAVFLQTLPYRFYCLLTLALVALVIFTGRDFGPMWKAEHRARSTGALVRPGGRPLGSETGRVQPSPLPPSWIRGLMPIATVLVVTLEEIFRAGGGWALTGAELFSLQQMAEIFFAGSGARPIFFGSVAGLVVASALARLHIPGGEIVRSALTSTSTLGFAIVLLLEAWMIGAVCRDLHTADYLVALFSGGVEPVLFPSLLFVVSGLVAFATGSSWSTMAILLPNVVALAASVGAEHEIGSVGMVLVSLGAVLEGAIFGDHCSPISDTTVLASVSAASDHVDHVRTQAPYALLAAGVAIVAGYIPTVAWGGWGFAFAMGTGLSALALVVVVVGKPVLEGTSG